MFELFIVLYLLIGMGVLATMMAEGMYSRKHRVSPPLGYIDQLKRMRTAHLKGIAFIVFGWPLLAGWWITEKVNR